MVRASVIDCLSGLDPVPRRFVRYSQFSSRASACTIQRMEDVLRRIVAKASSIHERLTPDLVPLKDSADEAMIDARTYPDMLRAIRG